MGRTNNAVSPSTSTAAVEVFHLSVQCTFKSEQHCQEEEGEVNRRNFQHPLDQRHRLSQFERQKHFHPHPQPCLRGSSLCKFKLNNIHFALVITNRPPNLPFASKFKSILQASCILPRSSQTE